MSAGSTWRLMILEVVDSTLVMRTEFEGKSVLIRVYIWYCP